MSGTGSETQQHISELVDIVDDNDRVLGSMPRSQAYAENHRKRIAYVFVLNSMTYEVGLAVRGAQVSWRPLHYTATVGGHVMSGETGEQAAKREMMEEIGIETDLHLLASCVGTDPTNNQKFVDYIFASFMDEAAEMTLDPQEVDRIEFMPLEKALALSADEAMLRHPKLAEQLKVLHDHWPQLTGTGSAL